MKWCVGITVDAERRQIYWTQKGPDNPEILLTHLMEGIGIALDLKEERMFLTDLGGSFVIKLRLNACHFSQASPLLRSS